MTNEKTTEDMGQGNPSNHRVKLVECCSIPVQMEDLLKIYLASRLKEGIGLSSNDRTADIDANYVI